MGSQALYEYIDGNPCIALLDVRDTNDVIKIARNPQTTAINSAIEVDLTGQIASDTIGRRHYSGVGGSVDFITGAALSAGGHPIIALPSLARNGDSRISTRLKAGASVTITRAHSATIVTEYGIAPLFGRSLTQRARDLINIAHPSHRERLEREAREDLGVDMAFDLYKN
jgi:4-hydroxybutyrate CoA-transferase